MLPTSWHMGNAATVFTGRQAGNCDKKRKRARKTKIESKTTAGAEKVTLMAAGSGGNHVQGLFGVNGTQVTALALARPPSYIGRCVQKQLKAGVRMKVRK